MLLAVGQDHLDDAPVGKRARQALAVQRRHDRVADQENVRGRYGRLEECLLAQQARTDADRVGAILELYGECLHVTGRRRAQSITGDA